MPTTIHALYDTYRDARDAVHALEAIGVDSEDISIIANRSDAPEAGPTNTAEGAELGADVGAIAGGATGLLAGLGMITIPGLGPVIGAGWLLATMAGFFGGAAAGLAVGGIVGALVDAGVPEQEAHVYAEGVKRGGTLVIARVKIEPARRCRGSTRCRIAHRFVHAPGGLRAVGLATLRRPGCHVIDRTALYDPHRPCH
jgi:hypothetical protein